MNHAINRTIAMLLAALLSLATGCVPVNLAQQAVSACVANGGVPIIGKWSNTVDDCRFPPSEKK